MEQQRSMMPNGNGMVQQNMNSMQRPQASNTGQQIHAQIISDLRAKASSIPAGWQATFDIAQRTAKIMQLVSGLRLLDQSAQKCIQTAENFEERTLFESPNRDVYNQRIQNKLNEIAAKRQQHINNMQRAHAAGQMGMQMNNMGMPQNDMSAMSLMQGNGMGGMNLGMNMPNGGMGMLGGQMNGNGGQQNMSFPAQLQQQMRASPLPPHQQQQQPTPQQQNDIMDPSALQNTQMNPQAATMNQANPQQQSQNQQQNMNLAAISQQSDPREVNQFVQRLASQMSEDDKEKMRNQFLGSLDEQKRHQVANSGTDPLLFALRFRARGALATRNARAMGQLAQQNGGMQAGNNNMGMSANNGMQQTPNSQNGASGFNFSNMLDQRENAIKSQESGEQVVPASNNPNNNNGMGGQMNMSQGVNPQMLGNQNGLAGNQAQLQQLLARQELQKRQQQQAQNQLAQRQALANQQQANQLRGQPGGLNPQNALNGGQVNSPAMNMLNRPMAPPGSTTPSTTPQPNRPAGMAQTPVNGANQIMQQHQTMLNQNSQQMNQGGQGMSQQQWNQQVPQIPDNLPPFLKEKLKSVPPHQLQLALDRVMKNPSVAQSMGLMNQGMSGNMGQNMNVGGLQTGQAQQAIGMPANMGSAVPGFNSQPPPNQQQQAQQSQQQQQQVPNDQPLRMQQTLSNFQQGQMKQRAMDLAQYPKQVLGSLGIAVPESITDWGKLKQHINQNQAILPPETLRKVNNAQHSWFQHHPDEFKKAVQELHRRMTQAGMMGPGQGNAAQQQQQGQQQQQNPAASRPASSMAIQNGQAPAAQMVQPNAGAAQQGANINAGGPNMVNPGLRMNPPPPHEINTFRTRFPQLANGLTDEQIGLGIMQRRMQVAQQNGNINQLPQHLQNQLRQQQAQAQAQAQALQNGAQQGNAANQHQRPPQAQQNQNQQVNKQGQAQGQKRAQPGSDDVVEIPNPNAAIKVPQAPPMQQSQSQQRPGQQGQMQRFPTQAELDQMKPGDRLLAIQRMRQLAALKQANNAGALSDQNFANLQQQQQQAAQAAQQAQAQQAQNPNQQQQQQQPPRPPMGQTLPPEQAAQLRAILSEVVRTNPKGAAIHLDSPEKQQVQTMLKKLWQPMANIEKTFAYVIRFPQQFSEDRIKQAFRCKLKVMQNAADSEGTIKDYISVTLAELKQIETFAAVYYTDLKSVQDAHKAQLGQAQSQAQQAQQSQQQPTKAQQVPPTATLERKPSQAGNKKASAKPPPAPTENKPFDWGSPSPHGVPKYELQNNLTADKLKMPARKKQKTATQSESQESTTPASMSTSPKADSKAQVAAGKMQPQQAQRPVEAPKAPQYPCDDPFCDFSINGFETEEQLKQHKEAEHQPIDDPLSFLFESAIGALDLDEDGNAIPEKKEDVKRPVSGAALLREKSGAKKGAAQTPNIKQEGATPVTPSSAGKAASKVRAAAMDKKTMDGKVPDSTEGGAQKEKTLCEVMAEKVGFDMPSDESKEDKNGGRSAASTDARAEEDSWLNMLPSALSSKDGYVDPWTDLSAIDDWGFDDYRIPSDPASSAQLTPLSEPNSQSSHDSDISRSERLRINFKWDAFGNGDTGVPDFLLPMSRLGLSPVAKAGKSEDVPMADGDAAEGAEKKGETGKDPWDWSDDCMDWDTVFGPNAGLDGNDNV